MKSSESCANDETDDEESLQSYRSSLDSEIF